MRRKENIKGRGNIGRKHEKLMKSGTPEKRDKEGFKNRDWIKLEEK